MSGQSSDHLAQGKLRALVVEFAENEISTAVTAGRVWTSSPYFAIAGMRKVLEQTDHTLTRMLPSAREELAQAWNVDPGELTNELHRRAERQILEEIDEAETSRRGWKTLHHDR